MQISKLMTPNPITLQPDDLVQDCLDVFEENRIHHIPVITEDNEVVGMVSSKDFENFQTITKMMSGIDNPIKVSDIMSVPAFSYFETVTVHNAAEAMVDNNIHAIVVINEKEEMVGILTSTDLLRYLSTLAV